MNFIYDIVLNFQDNYYQFFEWRRMDKVKNISRIAIYHIETKDLNDIKYNQVIIDEQFLAQVKEDNKKYKKLMCLVSDTKQTIGIMIAQDGTITKRSSLLFEEEEEANNYAKTLPLTKIDYVKNIKVLPKNCLRIELEKKDTLIEYLTKNNDLPTLKYLYYEYFQEECDDANQIKKILLAELEKEWTKKQNNLYQIIQLITSKKLSMKKPS